MTQKASPLKTSPSNGIGKRRMSNATPANISEVFTDIFVGALGVIGARELNLMLAAEFFETIEAFLDHIKATSITHANSVIRAKGLARNDSHFMATEELLSEVDRGKTHLADIDEHVERPFRLNNADVID